MPVQLQSADPLNTDHLSSDLKGRSVRGGLLTLTSQGIQFVVQSVSTVVLARLLTPSDFGLVAMVVAITGLATAFADLGLSEATIQRKEITHAQVSALFWVNAAIGLGLTLITMSLAPVLAWFYHEPRLVLITLIASLTFLIGGLRVQPDALLKRQMRFSAIAFRDVTSMGLAVPIAILIALRGGGYWALVSVPLTSNTIVMILSWVMVKWRPSWPRRGADVASMIAFGGNVAASYMIINLSRSADNVLIGRYWGAYPLGLYSRAYNLLMLPVRQLTGPVASVAVPAFSRIQGDPDRFARYYLRTMNLVIWVSAPIFGYLFVAAQPVIILMLGNRWREAAPVFQILAISALAQFLLESSVWLFISRGQSRNLLKLWLVISPLIVASYAIGLPFGIKGVALSGSLMLLCIIPGMLRYTFRGTEITLSRLGSAIVWPLTLSILSVLLGVFALKSIHPNGIFQQFLLAAASFIIVYSLAALVPAVRSEVASFRTLMGDLRPSS